VSKKRGRFKKGEGSHEEEFELNIASIIDCFTVLITYLLFSASFISLGVIDASSALVGSENLTEENLPKVNVAVALQQSGKMEIHVTGAEQRVIEVPSRVGGALDLEAMAEQLTQIKNKYTDVQAATLAADDDVEYRLIVKAAEVVRKAMPNVAFGEMQPLREPAGTR